MTTRRFPSATVDQVLNNAERVLQFADPTDIEVLHLQDRITATRRYSWYAVLAAGFGYYTFELSASQEGSDVVARLAMNWSGQPVQAVPTVAASGMNGITATAGVVSGNAVRWKHSYELFFSRLEALMGTNQWVMCREAREKVPSGAVDALCLLADDKIPERAPLAPKTKQYAERIAAERIAEQRARTRCGTNAECTDGRICFDGICRK